MNGKARLGIGGGRVPRGKAGGLIDTVGVLEEEMRIEILLVNADMVFGREHLESAAEHANRAFSRGTNVADSRMLEVLLYTSGERQLSRAIEKLKAGKGTGAVAVVVSDAKKLSKVMRELEIGRDDSVLAGNAGKLRKFGISARERSSVPAEKMIDLVLERVALVDVLK